MNRSAVNARARPKVASQEGAKLNRFRRDHHLIDSANKVIYCVVAKNACSTMKFQFLRRLSEDRGYSFDPEGVNRNVHRLAISHSMRDLPKTMDEYYTFCIVRHPIERLVSAFLEKFVRLPDFVPFGRELLKGRYSGSKDDLRFVDFISAIMSSPLNELNEHWMPQADHLIDGVQYDLIEMRSIARHPKLTDLYTDLSSNIRPHTTSYGEVSVNASAMTSRELNKFKAKNGYYPKWTAFKTEDVDRMIAPAFDRDLPLWERAWRG